VNQRYRIEDAFQTTWLRPLDKALQLNESEAEVLVDISDVDRETSGVDDEGMNTWRKGIAGWFAISAVLVVLTDVCLGQEDFQSKVDEYIQGELRTQRIPGLSLAIMTNGQIALAKGYGLASVEHNVPVKPETIFQSGSVGKQFTATVVMMLAEEGKVGLDDRITKYFADAPRGWTNVAVRHLLTHTAGFTDYPKGFDFRRDYTEDELLQRIMTVPLAFSPGEKWSYSNLGYVTLGILIHKVTGKFYGDFLRERIFTPLGMNTARVITETAMVTNRAAGYRLVKGELRNQEWVSPSLNTTADGSLYLTVLDMARWDAALYTDKLLKRASLEQMWTPMRLNDGKSHGYGFGWFVTKAGGHRVIEHGGAWQGFVSHIVRYPDDGMTVVVFANLAGSNVEKIAHAVAASCRPELGDK
jgi:CubicO group peptidase (beta-lactamase class C family)